MIAPHGKLLTIKKISHIVDKRFKLHVVGSIATPLWEINVPFTNSMRRL